MLVIDRYVLRECLKAWLGVVVVLLVLTLGVGFVQVLADAVAGDVPVTAVLTVAALGFVENLRIVLPVSLLLAIMLTVGRLCSDNEMAAMAAGGVGLARLYRPFGLLAIVLAGFSAWLSLFAAPQAARAIAHMEAARSAALMQIIEPGQFTIIDGGTVVFYAGAIDADSGAMYDIFVRVRRAGANGYPGLTVITAARALQERNPASGQRTLVLFDGWRYEGVPGRHDFRITHFAEYGIRLQLGDATTTVDGIETRPSAVLLARDDRAATAELFRRLGAPLMLLVLAVLAVPLGYLPPRSGRYGKLVLGVMVYVAYANVLRLGEVWIQDSRLPVVLGLWWVHGVVLLLALMLLGRREGWVRRLRGAR